MAKDLSWAKGVSYQPRFELKGARDPQPKSKVVAEARSIRASKATSRLKNKLKVKAVGFDSVMSQLCSEVEVKSNLRKLTPAELRARRHAEARFNRR